MLTERETMLTEKILTIYKGMAIFKAREMMIIYKLSE